MQLNRSSLLNSSTCKQRHFSVKWKLIRPWSCISVRRILVHAYHKCCLKGTVTSIFRKLLLDFSKRRNENQLGNYWWVLPPYWNCSYSHVAFKDVITAEFHHFILYLPKVGKCPQTLHVCYWILFARLYPMRRNANNCACRDRENFTTELNCLSRLYLCHSYLLSIVYSIFVQTVYRPILRPTLDVGHAMNYWWYEWIWKCFHKRIHHFDGLSAPWGKEYSMLSLLSPNKETSQNRV